MCARPGGRPGYPRTDGGIEPAADADGRLPTGEIDPVDARGIVSVTDRGEEITITDGARASPRPGPSPCSGPAPGHPAPRALRRYVTALPVLGKEAADTWRCQVRGGRGPSVVAMSCRRSASRTRGEVRSTGATSSSLRSR